MGAFPQQRADVETYLMPDGSCVLFDPRLGEGFTLNVAGGWSGSIATRRSRQRRSRARWRRSCPKNHRRTATGWP